MNTWPAGDSGSTSRNPTVETVVTVWYAASSSAEAEQHVADGADHQHQDQRDERAAQSPPVAHWSQRK